MKVCLITEFFYPDSSGSTPSLLSELMRCLKDKYADLEIDVITTKHFYRATSKQLTSFEDWNGVRIHRFSTPRTNRPSTLLRLVAGIVFALRAAWRLLWCKKYDLVFVGTNPPTTPIAARIARKFKRTPYVYLIHDLYPDVLVSLGVLKRNSSAYSIARYIQKRWLDGSNRIVVVGRCIKDNIVANYGIEPVQVDVIPNWSNPEQICPQQTSKFREKHKLKGFVVLYAGNFGQAQGIDGLLDAATLMRDTSPDITFVLVGDGAERDMFEARILAEKLINVCVFPTVSLSEYPDVLAAADVSLIPLAANIDGLGVPCKFYGTLASGKPIIALVNSTSEVARVLAERDCGIQVDRDKPEDLVSAIETLRTLPNTVKRMGDNARRALEEHYTLDKAVEHFYDIFVAVANEPKVSR